MTLHITQFLDWVLNCPGKAIWSKVEVLGASMGVIIYMKIQSSAKTAFTKSDCIKLRVCSRLRRPGQKGNRTWDWDDSISLAVDNEDEDAELKAMVDASADLIEIDHSKVDENDASN